MENDYDYYVYVFRNRVVKIVKSRKLYDQVTYPNVKTYRTSSIPKGKTISDVLYNFGFSFDQDGFYEISDAKEDDTVNLDSLKRMTNIITILEKFESISSYIKSSIFQKSVDADIYNRILMHQIESYEKDNTNIGNLLEAEFKCSKYETYDSLIESIKLKWDDASEMFAFIKYKSFELKNLLKNNNFIEANNINKEMYQKMRV